MIVAGVLVAVTGAGAWDTVVAVAIGAFVAVRAVLLGREVLAVLGQHVPQDVDLDAVVRDLEAVPGVAEVHDLHAWTLTSGMNVATAHLVLRVGADSQVVLNQAQATLRGRHGMDHATLQVEANPAREVPRGDLVTSPPGRRWQRAIDQLRTSERRSWSTDATTRPGRPRCVAWWSIPGLYAVGTGVTPDAHGLPFRTEGDPPGTRTPVQRIAVTWAGRPPISRIRCGLRRRHLRWAGDEAYSRPWRRPHGSRVGGRCGDDPRRRPFDGSVRGRHVHDVRFRYGVPVRDRCVRSVDRGKIGFRRVVNTRVQVARATRKAVGWRPISWGLVRPTAGTTSRRPASW